MKLNTRPFTKTVTIQVDDSVTISLAEAQLILALIGPMCREDLRKVVGSDEKARQLQDLWTELESLINHRQ